MIISIENIEKGLRIAFFILLKDLLLKSSDSAAWSRMGVQNEFTSERKTGDVFEPTLPNIPFNARKKYVQTCFCMLC